MPDYIQAECHTALQGYDLSITKLFYEIPRKGDLVRVLYLGEESFLAVSTIFHEQVGDQPFITVTLVEAHRVDLFKRSALNLPPRKINHDKGSD